MTPGAVVAPAAARGLAELEDEWRRRFLLQPKLPSSALLTGAVAMACGFGMVMFLAFAAATGFHPGYLGRAAIFGALALALGLTNRWLARRWFREVVVWSAERNALLAELERARSAAGAQARPAP